MFICRCIGKTELLADVLQPLVDDGLDVVVRQGVEHGLALPPGLHQPDVFQCPELVGDGGLGEPQQCRDVA